MARLREYNVRKIDKETWNIGIISLETSPEQYPAARDGVCRLACSVRIVDIQLNGTRSPVE